MNREQALQIIRQGLASGMSAQEILAQIKPALDSGTISVTDVGMEIQNSPSQQARVGGQQAAAEQQMKASRGQELIGLLGNLGYIGSSLGQISTANQGAAGLVKPSLPNVPGLSSELSQALYTAQSGANINNAINPVKQEIQDAYTAALNQAQVSSGGQAGTYTALANLANIQRMKSANSLVPVAQQVQMQNQGMVNDLLQARLGERQNQFMNQYYNTQMALDQYDQDAAAIGGAGSAGRTNLANAVGGATQSLQNLTPYYTGFDNNTSKYMDDVRRRNIRNNYAPIYSPYDTPNNQVG